jgi:hypothetical protein
MNFYRCVLRVNGFCLGDFTVSVDVGSFESDALACLRRVVN